MMKTPALLLKIYVGLDTFLNFAEPLVSSSTMVFKRLS